MSEVTLTLSQIESYSILKCVMETCRDQGVTKVNFPALADTGERTYTVPSNGSYIKLPPQVNFNGWTIIGVNQKNQKWPLFSLEKFSTDRRTDFHITKTDVDQGDYSQCPELSSGRKLLILTDRKEWTNRTDTYTDDGAFYRHDLIVLNDGAPENRPIAPWDTPSTELSYYYYEANDIPVIIENLTFKRYRNPCSYGIMNLIRVDGKYDVTFRNIIVDFVENSGTITKNGDLCFEVYNSAHVKFENITVNGTYSAEDEYGYAFYLENVYNLSLRAVDAMGLWGVIATKSLNRGFLKNCVMNRFDIHCYGRDVKCIRCTFETEHNDTTCKSCDYGSMYGTLYYEKCIFNKIRPLFLPNNYHAYTGFDFVMDSCIIDTPNQDNTIICAGLVSDLPQSPRPELQNINWPNVHIINLKLHDFSDNSVLSLFTLNSAPVNPTVNTIGYISQATVSYGKWTNEDNLIYPDVNVGSPAVPSSFTLDFSNFSSSLHFDNQLRLQSANDDEYFNDMNNNN